ncbi:MAG TPA: zinc ABC transporter substrate-binding protein [Firmicutes bacterium]|nr:zinc ABC transporter substrate-binding protein [Bacillota bacterium]
MRRVKTKGKAPAVMLLPMLWLLLITLVVTVLPAGRLSVVLAAPGPALGTTSAPGTGGTSTYAVVVTTTFLADITARVAGERAEVHALLRPGADPHSYQPVPGDIRQLSKAALFVVHGAGLDSWADRLSKSAGTPTIVASRGLSPMTAEGEENPHFWLDPLLVKTYVDNIHQALCQVDPVGCPLFGINAMSVKKSLDELHLWIEQQVAVLPPERRLLITYHDTFHYFASRYGFTVLGSIVHSAHPEAEPSSRQLAELTKILAAYQVPVIFTETTVNPKLAVALGKQASANIKIATLYTGSLSAPDGPAADYFTMMRYNTRTIVESLKK